MTCPVFSKTGQLCKSEISVNNLKLLIFSTRVRLRAVCSSCFGGQNPVRGTGRGLLMEVFCGHGRFMEVYGSFMEVMEGLWKLWKANGRFNGSPNGRLMEGF